MEEYFLGEFYNIFLGDNLRHIFWGNFTAWFWGDNLRNIFWGIFTAWFFGGESEVYFSANLTPYFLGEFYSMIAKRGMSLDGHSIIWIFGESDTVWTAGVCPLFEFWFLWQISNREEFLSALFYILRNILIETRFSEVFHRFRKDFSLAFLFAVCEWGFGFFFQKGWYEQLFAVPSVNFSHKLSSCFDDVQFQKKTHTGRRNA